MARKERSCPRCGGDIDVLLLVKCSTLMVAVAKCHRCGRSWGIGVEEIRGYNIPFKQGKVNAYRQKWNKGNYGKEI